MADSGEITDLVHQFMVVTGAEDTVAMCYLQQSSWNVEVSKFKIFILAYNAFKLAGFGSL